MSSILTLEALEVLDAIDSKGSFANAANALNRVPSAISYTMHKLEQDLGVSLFQREGRKSVLTPSGQHLLEQGRQLLAAANQLTESTQQVATGWEPKLRIATDHLLPSGYLYPLLKQLYEQQPAIDIELSQEVLAGIWEALITDRVDLIVGAASPPPPHKGIRSIEWQTLEMIFVANPNHPVCQHQEPLDEKTINQYRAIIVRDSSEKLPSISRGVFNLQHPLYVPNMTTKIDAHRNQLGIGTIPKTQAKEALRNNELKELKLENPIPKATLYIAWKVSHRGQALHWLVKQLQQQQLLDS
jgi:DNA-binding transcriptional LysR family regulator